MNQFSIVGTKEYVHSLNGQGEIKEFTDHLRLKAGTKEAYLELCKAAENQVPEGPEIWVKLLELFEPYIRETPPGHDPGHIHRDLLHAFALAKDPYVAKAAYKSDVFAGQLGGCFHDIGNAITWRYEDFERMAGHAEIGAWFFFQVAKDLVSEPLLTLAAYAIAAHTHYLKSTEVKEPVGFKREPYPYDLWEIDGKPIGLAVLLTRFADRLDTNGVTLFARHLLASADAVESGKGIDITGEMFYEIKKEEFHIILLPEIRGTPSKPPTALEHVRNFAGSNFTTSVPYGRDDRNFPVMMDLLLTKVFQFRTLDQIVKKAGYDQATFSEFETRSLVKNTLRQISGSPYFQRSWDVLAIAWNGLEPWQQAKWRAGFQYVGSAYVEWVQKLGALAGSDEAFKPIVDKLVDSVI